MNQKLIFILLLATLLSACSNRQSPEASAGKPSLEKREKTSSVLIDSNNESAVEPVVKTNPPSLKAEPLEATSEANDSTSEPNLKRDSADNTSLAVESLEPAIIRPETVFDRLRAGFELPQFESADVDNYLRWKTGHPTYLENLFKRAEPFLPYLVKEVEARQLPLEIVLLPAVESAFKPRAVSRSKAAGLWQFIPSTGKSFGLKQDWWYDGRSDALRATSAALDYLEQLNSMFDGDWWLTLAAYNAGPGTIKRALKSNKRQGKPQEFEHLKLRSETRRYIPKLVALREIVKSPAKYGVELPEISLDDAFVAIPIRGQIDLRKFAKASQTDLDEIRHLNASFKRWATPPQGQHNLLVPQPHTLTFNELQSIVEDQSAVELLPYVIKNGDTLSTIAQRNGVSVAALRRANNISGSAIRAGRTLLVPVIDGQTSVSRGTAGNFDSSKKLVHTVKAGDTLWSISRRYNVGVKQLLEWNQLAIGQILRLNQQLMVLLK